jgi:uncharacterized protein (TIGR02598 family)
MNFFKSSSSPMNLHPATPSRLPQAAPRSEKPGIVEKMRRTAGFTLVEVTLAMGLVSFALLPLMALLPQGLSTVRYSATETALGAMLGKVRSELNQSSFDTLNQTLPSAASPWYFDEAGTRVDAADTQKHYFVVSAAVDIPNIPAAPVDFQKSAKRVRLRMSYPAFAAAQFQYTHEVALLTARQNPQQPTQQGN